MARKNTNDVADLVVALKIFGGLHKRVAIKVGVDPSYRILAAISGLQSNSLLLFFFMFIDEGGSSRKDGRKRQGQPANGRAKFLDDNAWRDRHRAAEEESQGIFAPLRILQALGRSEWVSGGFAQGVSIKVSVSDVKVEHEVRMQEFTKWLNKLGGSPREVCDRWEIRKILGMPLTR